MSIIYSYPCIQLNGVKERITISTGPIIKNKAGNKVLLHLSGTTKKYQFIWGRLDDSLNFRENALTKAREVIGDTTIILSEEDPLILTGMIDRDGNEENILLIHYIGTIENEDAIGEAKWFNLEEVLLLDAENKTSSENVRIASQHFLQK